MNTDKTRVCPMCQGAWTNAYYWHKAEDDIIANLTDIGFDDLMVYKCHSCGHIWHEKKPTEKEMNDE